MVFSGRRRHTGLSRDWRSDVCSSVLVAVLVGAGVLVGQVEQGVGVSVGVPHGSRVKIICRPSRSEERRVGKECRLRWSRCNPKEEMLGSKVVERMTKWHGLPDESRAT